MKKKPRIIISATAVVLCAAAFAVFYFAPVNLSNDELENALWRDALARAALTGAIAGVAALCNYNIFFVRGARMRCADYLWCLPCLAVALANFPYSALISGTAVIERADLLPAFISKCLFIATSEELLFRGVLLRLLDEVFSESCHKFLKCTIISSAVFALFHLLNLLDGAAAGATLLQVGYTFLTGLMFACVTIRTHNIFTAIILHFIFDIGGFIVSDLGTGPFQDVCFWILTAVAAAVCATHLIIFAVKRDRAECSR